MSGAHKPVNPPADSTPAFGASDPDAITMGTLMGGRLSYGQFRTGHRTALEPVLMAAFVPARPGARVLEAGCGAGAGLLCLGHRIGGLVGAGIEADPRTAALARDNLAANGWTDWPVHDAVLPDISALPERIRGFDHAMANPPWHRPTASVPSQPRRRLARTAMPDTIDLWVRALGALLRPRGTLTLALPAARADAAFAALDMHGFGSSVLLPLWPRAGQAAKLCLIRAVHGGKGDCVLSPGLVLHTGDGRLTDEANAILRDGAALLA